MSTTSPFDLSLPKLPSSLLTIGAPVRRDIEDLLALIQGIEDAASEVEEYSATIDEAMSRVREEFANAESANELTGAIDTLLEGEQNIAATTRTVFEGLDKLEAGAPSKPGVVAKSLADLLARIREAMTSVLESFRDTRLVLEVRRAKLINAAAGEDAAVEIDSDENLDDFFRRARG
jgi:methyl-accepting chemotaxis protein